MSVLRDLYIKVVLRKPIYSLLILVFLTLLALTQFANIKLDASADALLLKGDPALEFYRETSKRYGSSEFILLTWQPSSGEGRRGCSGEHRPTRWSRRRGAC